jgi:quinol monooxygenase YgiN
MVETHAKTAKPANGSQEIFWTVTFAVNTDHLSAFKKVVRTIVAATMQEPGALEYVYTISADQTTVDVVERYCDSEAVIFHVTQTFGPHADTMLTLAKPIRFIVYGTPSTEVVEILAGFNPVYMTPFDGFTR